MDTMQTRLIHARERLNLSQQDIADMVGMKQPSYYQLESGKTKKSRFIYEIAQALQVNPEWLITGIGDMENGAVASMPTILEESSSWEFVIVGGKSDYPPVMIDYLDEKASCGGGYANGDYDDKKGQVAFTVEFLRDNDLPIDGEGLVLMHGCGDSMGYTIPHATLMLVNKKENQFYNMVSGQVYVFNANGEMICKRAFKNLDGSITLVSDNSDKNRYPDVLVNEEKYTHFEIFGRVRYTFNKF